MAILLFFWLFFGVLALGPPAFIFVFMKRKAKQIWPTTFNSAYAHKFSIIIPTFNEADIIGFKLANISKLTYPKHLTEIIVVDSNSSDSTAETVRAFSEKENIKINLLVEKQRKGKSNALNFALANCSGEVIVISDADCFWPSDILEQSIPYLADPKVGAIGGPKLLFNSNQSWVTRMEENYLKSANALRLGESKSGSTVFFEGGFSAFKKEALERFDPYGTGSDDCGTIIGVIEKNYRAMLVKEAKFYSSFPVTFRGKINVKIRRTNQLIRVFKKYFDLLLNGKVKGTKSTVIPNTLLYLVSPTAFVFLLVFSALIVSFYPLLLLLFGLLVIPQVRFYAYQIIENNILLFLSILSVISGKKFSVWAKPEDRLWLTEENLASHSLI
jgi:poly-beta-1,6-N-acetyl-D-glucosamine synthase